MRHFKCDLQMNCCFHEWEKTKLEVKLLIRRGISRNMGPKAVWRVHTSDSHHRKERLDWLSKKTFLSLYSKYFNDFVELLMELKHCVRGFFPGSGKHLTCTCNRWFVTPCDWSLLPIGYVRVEIGTSAFSKWNWRGYTRFHIQSN